MGQVSKSSEAAAYFEAFLCAGIVDLCRLADIPAGDGSCVVRSSRGCVSALFLTSEVPAVAQLALYLLLVAKGLQPKHKNFYPRRDRFQGLLKRVYSKALKAWDDGNLNDVRELQPGIHTLAGFARRNVPEFEGTSDGLDAFGVKDVRISLAILTEKLALTLAREIAKNPAKATTELVGASLVASATSPGVIERIGHDRTVEGVMHLGIQTGLNGMPSSKPGTNSAGIDDLRRFLKRADKVLGN
jgi:hypothetical protein